MNSACLSPLSDLRELILYPRDGFKARLAEICRRLAAQAPEAASELQPFLSYCDGHSDTELEEAYTQSFDLNPKCALEVGWHLYGEDYKRGEFLVEMRALMRRLNLPEDAELPDHLGHVLEVLSVLEEDEARALACARVLPALATLRPAASGNPYDAVLKAIEVHLQARYGAVVGGEKE